MRIWYLHNYLICQHVNSQQSTANSKQPTLRIRRVLQLQTWFLRVSTLSV